MMCVGSQACRTSHGCPATRGLAVAPLLLFAACCLTGTHAFVAPGGLLLRPGGRARAAAAGPARLGRLRASLGSTQYTGSEDGVYNEGIAKVKAGNAVLLPHLNHVKSQDFFRYYAVDLLSSCTYFPTIEFPCDMEKCDVDSAEEVPDEFRQRDHDEHDFRLDGWVRWDMPGDFTDYYDLDEVPEKYTEYQGQAVWKFIHEKICFQVGIEQATNDIELSWKKDFNRAISGLHSSISAHVLNTMGLDEEASLKEYMRRIGDVPEAVSNLHFVYMLMLVAMHEARFRLLECGYMGKGDDILPSMRAIIEDPLLEDPSVQLAAAAMRAHAQSPGARVWKARLRTRDLLGVMNCVQCNRCRLHGKVASLGLGVALQVLLGNDGSGDQKVVVGRVEKLHRVEVAALINTTAKFARAVEIVAKYEAMVEAGKGGGAA